MTQSLPIAVLLCAALVAADLTLRALRIHLFVRAAGYSLRFREVFVLNVFGDAAAAATPLRLGGEAARLMGLAHGGVPVAAGIPLLAVEVSSYMAVVALAAAGVGWALAPEWWREVAPAVIAGARQAGPWVALALVVGVLAVRAGRRLRSRLAAEERGSASGALRASFGWPLAASVPLTLASIAARVAILPVLVATVAEPPPTGPLLVGSFLLIYGQVFLPTPGGLGGVEAAFAAGALGDLGEAATPVYVLWRAFTTLAPLLLGFGIGIPYYGAAAVRAALTGRATTTIEPEG